MKLSRKTSQGTSEGDIKTVFVLKCCMLHGQSFSGKVWGPGLEALPPSNETFYCLDIASNCVIWNTDIPCTPSPSYVCAACYNFSLAASARSHMCSPACFGFTYTNESLTNYHLQRRFHEWWNHYSLKIWYACEQLVENTLNSYTKSDLLTKKSVLLPGNRYENGLLFTKQLHMMNISIC